MAPKPPLLLLFQCILCFQNFKVVIGFLIHNNLLVNSYITTLALKSILSSQQLNCKKKEKKSVEHVSRLQHALKLPQTAIMHLISPVISCTDN